MFKTKLNHFYCNIKGGLSAEQCLEKLKCTIDNKEAFCALLTNLMVDFRVNR